MIFIIILLISNLICSAPFYKIIVPTVDTVRYEFLVTSLISNSFPVLMVGPVGTGKTSTAQTVLSKLSGDYNTLTVNMSSQVCPNLCPNMLFEESFYRQHQIMFKISLKEMLKKEQKVFMSHLEERR